jgi:cell division septation protein DedD
MVGNDNDFFEEQKGEGSDAPREESNYDQNMGLSAGGNSYGEEEKKRGYNSGSIISILLAVGIGIAVAAIVVALVSPKKRPQRNVADIVSERRPGEVDEMRRFVEEKGIIEVPTPTARPVPEAPVEPRPRERAERRPVEQAVQRPATPRPVPAELRLIERPSSVRGEVVVERDTSPAPAPAPAAPAPARAAATGGAWTVQLASGDNAARTEAEWGRLLNRHGAILSGLTHTVIPAEVNGRQVFRLRVIGFANFAEADALCTRLKAAGAACFATR